MTNFQKVLTNIVNSANGGQEEVASKLDVSASYISMALSGKRKLSKPLALKLEKEYSYKSEELLQIQTLEVAGLDKDFFSHLPEPAPKENPTVKDVMTQLGKISKNKEKNTPQPNDNAKPIVEEEDYIWMETQKIPEKAGLSLSTHYFAESYVNALEKGLVRVKREHSGKYYEVEACGDSMNDGSNRILDKDWFLAREIPREKWIYKLHFHNWNAFYFLHNTHGHIIKEVISHDPETGILELRSWNQDKVRFPDFTINIKDCYIVANIVKLINRDFNTQY